MKHNETKNMIIQWILQKGVNISNKKSKCFPNAIDDNNEKPATSTTEAVPNSNEQNSDSRRQW